ncbi:hypothetical protein B7494_g1040 [Chlorociboria aeruginascens]|nr:hypothetical protein B7494_g1040 [Chlorociboria aeruginascens]
MSETQGIPAADTDPSKALPVPLPTPSLPSLQSWLPLYLSKTDAHITHLTKILSTRSGTDTLLLTICYSSLLSSSILSSISLHRLHSSARQIIEKAIALPPNTTIIIDSSSTFPTSSLLILSQRLKTFSTLVSDVRMFARLWGLLFIWKWGKSIRDNPPKDTVIRGIGYAQVLVNVLYQYLENGAYLSSKGVLGWSPQKQNRAWVWSSRFWMMHVGLDFWRLWRETVIREQGEKGEGDEMWTEKWRREVLVNAAYAPLTVHWSLEQGLVSPFWVGLFGSIAGAAGLRNLWRVTSEV